VYFMSQGVVVAQGSPAEIRASRDVFVHQFVHGEADGPVPYQYPAPEYRRDLFAEAV
jgi:phospholipid/cholesterol/gamma-HCH transport system ATP-binding protein